MERMTPHPVEDQGWTNKPNPPPALRITPVFDKKIYPIIENATLPSNRTASAQVPTATPWPFPSDTQADTSGFRNTTVPVALAGLAGLVVFPAIAIAAFFYVRRRRHQSRSYKSLGDTAEGQDHCADPNHPYIDSIPLQLFGTRQA